MKAVQVHHFGSPDVLTYEDIPIPEPAPGQVLIRVESVAVNYSDVMRRSNATYPFPTSLPFIPGSEVAGRIVAVGESVTELTIDMPVLALVGRDGSSGYAQYAVASATQVIPIPPGLSPDQACAVLVAGGTALLILQEVAQLKPGETVLVPGAAGGVGSYAIQIAKCLGARTVIGAASSETKRAVALKTGADGVVDYTQPDWADSVRQMTEGRGVDVALEMSGGAVFGQTLQCLAPFGRLVVYGMASQVPLHLDALAIRHLFYDPACNQSLLSFNLGLWFGLRSAVVVAAMQQLLGWVATGQIKVPVDQVLPLSEAAQAHRLLQERQTTGKIVLKPWPDL